MCKCFWATQIVTNEPNPSISCPTWRAKQARVYQHVAAFRNRCRSFECDKLLTRACLCNWQLGNPTYFEQVTEMMFIFYRTLTATTPDRNSAYFLAFNCYFSLVLFLVKPNDALILFFQNAKEIATVKIIHSLNLKFQFHSFK